VMLDARDEWVGDVESGTGSNATRQPRVHAIDRLSVSRYLPGHLRSDEGLAAAELLRGIGVLFLELFRRTEIRIISSGAWSKQGWWRRRRPA
jgi:hypothetical protein